MRGRTLALVIPLILSVTVSVAAPAPKSGSSCAKAGQSKVHKGKKFTCIKSGKKLIWSKGVSVPASMPSPMPSPTPSPTYDPVPVASPTPTPSQSPAPTPTPEEIVNAMASFAEFPKSKDAPQTVNFSFGPNADKEFSASIVEAANKTMALFVDFHQDPRPFPVFYGAYSDVDWVINEWLKNGYNESYQQDDIRNRSSQADGFIVNYWGSPQGHLTIVLSPERLAKFRGDSPWRKVYVTHHVVHGIQSRITGARFEYLGCWGTEGGAEFYGALVAARELDMDYLSYRNSQLGNWINSKPKVDLRQFDDTKWFETLKTLELAPCSDTSQAGNLHYNTGILIYEKLMSDFGHQKIMDWWFGMRSTLNWKAAFRSSFGLEVDTWYRSSAIPYLIREYQAWVPPTGWRGVG